VTSVAFVTYSFQSSLRRVGPMPMEPAETFAKELCRRAGVTGVRLETWMCVNSQEFSQEKPA
jgi:hypothetical protein